MTNRYLTNREIWWWSIGRVVGVLRNEWRGDSITVHCRGPLGPFFLRKAGLMGYSVSAPPRPSPTETQP